MRKGRGYNEKGNWKTLWAKSSIDEGWKHFWKKRNFCPPPPVSTYAVGCFVLPNKDNHPIDPIN